MQIFLNEGNQIHNFISSSGSGTVINYGSGSDFLTSYSSGSGSSSQKVTVPTVPVPVPQHWLQITMSFIHRQKHLDICLPTVGSQTWVRSGWEFFRTSGESNPRPWRWIKSARDQHVKCNERQTRPCPRAYYIRGSTPFHSCVEVRSPKLVSSEDLTEARAPSASYCSTEGVAPLHTAPPVPVILISSGHGGIHETLAGNIPGCPTWGLICPGRPLCICLGPLLPRAQ
jgi:hypothetical protein